MKVRDGCIDGNTLPVGYQIDLKTRKSVPGMNLVSYIQAHIHEVITSGGENGAHMILLPTSPSGSQSPVPSILNNNHSKSGQSF